MIRKQRETKYVLSRRLGISRASLYYTSKQVAKDWELKHHIEKVLHDNPSYGFRRVAIHLGINKKRAQRVMKIFGIRSIPQKGQKVPKTKENRYTIPKSPFHRLSAPSQPYMGV